MREEPICGQDVLDRLQGRRILVLGRESEIKTSLMEELKKMSRQTEARFEVSAQGEIAPEDYVILMGTAAAAPKQAQKRETQKYSWIREKKGKGEYLGSWMEFRTLTDTLQGIRGAKPAAVAFVSDSTVYGKLFGEPHSVREDEIGYLCHTDEDFQEAQSLRVAEHLCGRLAREDGINIRVARIQSPLQGDGDSLDGIPDMAGSLLRVLIFGTAGEPYNIPGPRQIPGKAEKLSPLSPNIVVEELTKIKSL